MLRVNFEVRVVQEDVRERSDRLGRKLRLPKVWLEAAHHRCADQGRVDAHRERVGIEEVEDTAREAEAARRARPAVMICKWWSGVTHLI